MHWLFESSTADNPSERELPSQKPFASEAQTPNTSSHLPFAPSAVADSGLTALPLPDVSPEFTMTESDIRICVQGQKFLSLFHGFHRPDDGLAFYLKEWGAICVLYDLEISPTHDLADDTFWQKILDDLEEGTYAGAGGGPPCSTFSAGRNEWDGGPRPLGEFPPELYGFQSSISGREGTGSFGHTLGPPDGPGSANYSLTEQTRLGGDATPAPR